MGNSDHSYPRRATGDIPDRGRPVVAGVRPRLHPRPAGAPFNRPDGVVSTDRRVDRRASRAVDTRHRQRMVHRGHPAGRARRGRQGRPAVPACCGGWRVDPVKAELGPRAWNRCPGLALSGAAGPRCGRPARLAHGVLLGRVVVGRAAGRGVLPTQAEAQARAAPAGSATGSRTAARSARWWWGGWWGWRRWRRWWRGSKATRRRRLIDVCNAGCRLAHGDGWWRAASSAGRPVTQPR